MRKYTSDIQTLKFNVNIAFRKSKIKKALIMGIFWVQFYNERMILSTAFILIK